MKKAIIIGCPGCGKSTFARALQKRTGIPLCHLDLLFWNEDKTTVSKAVFLGRLQKIMQNDEWIIDGNYGGSMELRFKECDTVFFLDYPVDVCLDGIASRKGKPRSDMPWVENDNTDEEIISFIKNYNSQSKPKVMSLIKKYSDRNIVIFHSRGEANDFFK